MYKSSPPRIRNLVEVLCRNEEHAVLPALKIVSMLFQGI